MKRLCLVLLLLAACVPSVHAQTITQRLQWNQSEPLATVLTWQTTVKVGAAAAVVVTPSCVTQGTGSQCTYQLPAVAPPGSVVTLTEINGGGSASGSATVPNGPSNPTNVSISITVTVP